MKRNTYRDKFKKIPDKVKWFSFKILLIFIFSNTFVILFSDQLMDKVFKDDKNSITFDLLFILFIILPIGISIYFLIVNAINKFTKVEENLIEKYKEGEECFRTTFEQAAVGISHTTIENKFIRFNKKFCEIVGHDEEELKNLTFRDISNEEDLEENLVYLNRLIKNEINMFSMEKRYIKKDGSTIWTNLTVSKAYESHNNIPYFIAVIEDISERKKAESALKESEELFNNVLKHSQDAFYRWNIAEGRYDYMSPVFEKMSGFKKQDFMRWDDNFILKKFIHPDDQNVCVRSLAENMLAEGQISDAIEYRFLCKDGNYRWVYDRYTTTKNEKKQPIFRYGVVQDIKERKEMEEQIRKAKQDAEEASLVKSEFIANMSHELRTPLNVILSALQLFELYISKNPEKYKFLKHMKAMKQNSYRLLRIINNLIDTTKIDAGFYEPFFNKYNIISTVKKITLSVADYANQKNIDVIFNSSIKEKIIFCDVDIIERIILNLLSNAIKFTPENGTIKVSITLKGKSIVISVKDNGIGIPKDMQKIIFERYKQVSQLLTREHEGSGIGLSLTKSLVEMHNGRISVISEMGQGSEFVLEFPDENLPSVDIKNPEVNLNNKNNLVDTMNIEFADIYK